MVREFLQQVNLIISQENPIIESVEENGGKYMSG